jgi:uncharacterized protein YpmS
MENKIDDDRKQKFNFWIYVGFIILALLFAIVIIGSLFYIFSNKSTSQPSYQSPVSQPSYQSPVSQPSYQSPVQSLQTNNRSSYISSLFKKGGRSCKKIFKRF